MMYSLIIPVYKNAQSLTDLVEAVELLNKKLSKNIEFIFVVDGNPENEYEILSRLLVRSRVSAQLIMHSKNFGSFEAIRTGLAHANGKAFATMAADLQEPPQLVLDIFSKLKDNDSDVVIATRSSRNDSLSEMFSSRIFWGIYKKFIQPEMPAGGVDMFGCNQKVRDTLIELTERNSSLIGLLFWIGFKRAFISYERKKRKAGKSAWTLAKKMKYMVDSIFSFSDLPIKFLIYLGVLGIGSSVFLSLIVLSSKLLGNISVPGYTATLVIVSFFSSLNIFSFGIIGLYLWRTFENTKNRPNAIIREIKKFPQP